MDHSYYQPFNHLQYPQYPPSPAPAPVPDLPLPYYDTPDTPTPAQAPGSPSDFIYNSSANATASIFRPSRPSLPGDSFLGYYPAMGYGPSRPVEQSFPTYLPSLPSLPEPSLPEPAPGLAEHRRQRQREPKMNMGPGPSKMVPPALSLGGNRGSNRGSNSGESTVVIKQEEVSSSPILVSMPMVPRELGVKKWEPRVPTEGMGQIKTDGKGREKEMFDPFGNTPGMQMENENRMGSEIGSGSGSGSGSGAWEERGEGVVERVVMPPMVPSIGMGMGMGMGTDMGMGMGMETGMGMEMETGMGMEPTLPKMGLFKPIRWDGPSSSSASRSSRSSKAKARRTRAWEAFEADGGDVHLQRTYGNQNENGSRNRNRKGNEETEDEQPSNVPISSSTHPRSQKRLKTSPSGRAFRPGSAETETETTTTVKIKQEPGLSPSPSAIFAQTPMYNNGTINNTGFGYESPGRDDPPSSRSISPLTRVPTPRRLLFPTPNRTSTGRNSQLSLRGVSKQLKKVRNRQMGLDREESGEQSREHSRERRGEGFWSLAGGGGGGGSQAQGRSTAAAQDEEIGEWASPRQQQQQQQQQQYRGSSEEKEEGWTTISGSSEEGEVSSHYENSYSCGQERNNAPGNTHQSSPFLPYGDQEWCHPFSSSSASTSPAPVPGSSSSARYGPGSAPSLSASQERVEQYRQAIQMVQDTCLEASKRYIRAHCVNRGARGGDSPDTSTLSHETVETRFARKARRKRKFNQRLASSSSSIFSSSSPSPPPSRHSRQRRKGKGKRQNRTKKRITTTPPSSPSSSNSRHSQPQPHSEIHCTDSLLPNISQICTLLWSRAQSLRLHDIDSIELHTARNMYWLMSWAETVAFAVAPTPTVPDSTSGTPAGTSVGSSFPGFGVSSLENLAASGRGQWNRPSSSIARRERDREHAISPWENLGEGLNEEGYMWRRRNSEEGGGFEMLESRNGAVWEQQREEMKRVFDEGGMLCEFLGYGEGVERLGRVRGFYGF